MPLPKDVPLINESAAAKIVGCSLHQLRTMHLKGKGPVVYYSDFGLPFYRKSEVEAWVEINGKPALQPDHPFVCEAGKPPEQVERKR